MTSIATHPTTAPTPVQLSTLPTLGAPLADGNFAGITTLAGGTHVAVVLLPDQSSDIDWASATQWAAQLGGVLPTRPIAAMLFANAKSLLRPGWHWTSDESTASYACECHFVNGTQYDGRKSFKGSAVAVRSIQLSS
jgi:hypothetical protein